MMLRIDERRVNDVVVLELRGRISAHSQEALAAAIDRRLARGDRRYVINVARASGAGTVVISALLGALMAVRRAGGDLRLVHVARGFDSVPVIVALHGYFAVFESDLDAIASFRSPAFKPAAVFGPPVGQGEVVAA